MPPHAARSLPVPRAIWEKIAQDLRLSPQHKRIVELILKNYADKQIVTELQRSHATIRTHIGRLFQYLQVDDRIDLILLICSLSHNLDRHHR